jgi:SAM-dependent methyltransferase
VVAADSSEGLLAKARDRVRAHGLTDRVEVREADLLKPGFSDGEFDGIVTDGRLAMSLEGMVTTLRRDLAPKGRLCVVYPVKVGRHPSPVAVKFWEERLGEALLTPKDVLQTLERAGYEPQAIETMSELELDEFYRSLEPLLPALEAESARRAGEIRREIELFRAHGGKASVSFALAVGRRKEPGEKPPASRTEG